MNLKIEENLFSLLNRCDVGIKTFQCYPTGSFVLTGEVDPVYKGLKGPRDGKG